MQHATPGEPTRRVALSARRLAIACALGLATAAGAVEEPIQPIPLVHGENAARVELGRRLFQDTRLSANNTVSCASCHSLARGGADGRDRSVGFSGQRTAVNAPTVFNAALNFRHFWNGRADALEAQVEAMVRDPVAMGSAWPDVVAKVSRDPDYQSGFAAAYKNGITQVNIQNAIATFERTLITPNSRFDRYLRGEHQALTDTERAGYAKFKQYGCVACHQGVNMGGNMFQKFGVMGDYFARRGPQSEADLGRYLVTRNAADKHVFKVPSLRNVALTAPYFHDGSAKTLEEAVDAMFKYQLGRTASAQDQAAIVQFLHTLTGEARDVTR